MIALSCFANEAIKQNINIAGCIAWQLDPTDYLWLFKEDSFLQQEDVLYEIVGTLALKIADRWDEKQFNTLLEIREMMNETDFISSISTTGSLTMFDRLGITYDFIYIVELYGTTNKRVFLYTLKNTEIDTIWDMPWFSRVYNIVEPELWIKLVNSYCLDHTKELHLYSFAINNASIHGYNHFAEVLRAEYNKKKPSSSSFV